MSIPRPVSHELPKTKSYSGLSITTKLVNVSFKYRGKDFNFPNSKIFGKVTETFSLSTQPLLITFLPAFVAPIPRSSTAGYLDPYILVIYKPIFWASALLILPYLDLGSISALTVVFLLTNVQSTINLLRISLITSVFHISFKLQQFLRSWIGRYFVMNGINSGGR